MTHTSKEIAEFDRFFRKGRAVFSIIFCGTLLGPALAAAQSSLDVCRVTTSAWSIQGKRGTGIYEVGKFPVNDVESGAKKSYRYSSGDDAFSIEAEIEYGDYLAVEKRKPVMINLSLAVNDFNAPMENTTYIAVEAGTTYGKKWGTIFVSKDIVKGTPCIPSS